jgi:perosamine synthetase
MVPSIQSMCISAAASIKDALKVIDHNAQGICFVTDEKDRFIGVVTDGDIRRALINGSLLTSELSKIVNTRAFSLPVETPLPEIQNKLTGIVRHIPLLDKEGRPVDYACTHRLHRVPVAVPVLGGNELEYVGECIRTGWISSQGSFVGRFEKAVADFCHAPHALAVSNGTTALHLALEALGIGEGDEVIVPDFTFAASINAILYARATPVLVDISLDTWTISVEEIKKAITPKTKAIMPVHIYGHPCHMDEIGAIAKEHDLLIIEDGAESLGSTYKGKQLGTFGDAATLSFFGNKVITTGEGGMVLFKNPRHYEKGKVLRDHGMSPDKRYWHETVGYNYRLTNLQAAVGVAQMEQLDSFLIKRKQIAEEYRKQLSSVKAIESQPLQPWASSCYWLYTVLVKDDARIDRDGLIKKLMMNGIETRPTFYPLHTMPIYQRYAGSRAFPNSLLVSSRGMSLPSSVSMDTATVRNIATRIQAIMDLDTYH